MSEIKSYNQGVGVVQELECGWMSGWNYVMNIQMNVWIAV